MKEQFLPFGIRDNKIIEKSKEDVRVRRFMGVQKILWKTEGKKCSVTGEEVLLEDRDPQINLNQAKACVLENKGETAGILLDFGVEFHGYVKLFIWSVNPGKVRLRIRFGESAMEAMSEIGGEKNATNDHINRDQIIETGFLSMPEIGPSGFRFVRIDLIDPNTAVSFKTVKGIFTYRELEYKGSFKCNDERLNRIWGVGAYTVHLNMQEYVWDGIKRDRLVWIGDMHPETSTIQAVFGYDESVPASLDLARNETPLPAVMSGISSYSLWWVMIQHGWYMQNGDFDYLAQQRDYLKNLLIQFSAYIDEEGRETLPNHRFLDWPSAGHEKTIHAGLQSLLRLSLLAGSELLDELGEKETAALCKEKAELLLKHIPDPRPDSGQDLPIKQAAALMALAGLACPKELNESIIKVDGSRNLSTFYGYYVLQAQAIAGDMKGALDNIRTYWGAMLDRGATTFWEDFNMDWLNGSGRIDELVPEGMIDIHGDFGNFCYKGFRHSLCHGWASGPTAFLSGYVLGVKPVAPGCKEVTIKPNLGDLEWAEGTYPTRMGNIWVRHTKNADGTVKTEYKVPEGVKVVE